MSRVSKKRPPLVFTLEISALGHFLLRLYGGLAPPAISPKTNNVVGKAPPEPDRLPPQQYVAPFPYEPSRLAGHEGGGSLIK